MARVTVNRIWQTFSGRVWKSSGIFWDAGDCHSHPELLDGLRAVRDGTKATAAWDVKGAGAAKW